MALTTMYSGKVNSPQTEISSSINDTVTTINLVDGTVLPDAPNLAVIGTDRDTAETILYGGKSGNQLTSVTRGFQGTARSWNSGEIVARNFTAYDYDTVKENISTVDSDLTTHKSSSDHDGRYYTETEIDNTVVKLTGSQNIGGVKTFSDFPVTPSSTPTSDYEVANKKYVDDSLSGGVSIPKANYTATVNPDVDDDSASDYEVGSRWINTNTDKEFVCLDATVGSAVWKDTTIGASDVSIQIGNVESFTANAGNEAITLTWGDPDDVVLGSSTLAEWAGTKIRRKTSGFPTDENDGVLVVENTVKDEYVTNGFEDTGLTNGTTYYYGAFPYTSINAYTDANAENQVSATPTSIIPYGLEWDQSTDTYTRLESAIGLTAEAYNPTNTNPTNDFDSIAPWSNIRRCNLADDGTVNAYYGDPTYTEDGSNGQVMVEIPKFYFKRDFVGSVYSWYIAAGTLTGYSVHPAFIRDGVEQDYIYISAYEGCAYDTSISSYNTTDSQVVDFSATTGDKLSSIANAKPLSGVSQSAHINNCRNIAQNRGANWQMIDYHSVSAIQLLLLVEYGTFDSQSAIGEGVVDKASGSVNESVNTGATTTLGNGSGYLGTNGLSSVSYRGIENFWGNIWVWVDGINIKADRNPWIADNNFVSDTFVSPYTDTGLTLPSSDNYISNIQDLDGFLPSAVSGSSNTYITDYFYPATGNRVAVLGGRWYDELQAGAWRWSVGTSTAYSDRTVSARVAFLNNT